MSFYHRNVLGYSHHLVVLFDKAEKMKLQKSCTSKQDLLVPNSLKLLLIENVRENSKLKFF